MALFHVARYAGPEAAGAEAEADGRARALLERLQCRARERQRQKQPQRQEAEPTAEAAGRRRRRPRRPRRREGCGAAGSPPEPRGKRRRLDGEAGGAGGAGSGEDAPVDPGGSSPAEGSAPPARGLLLGALGRSRAAKAQPFLPLWLAEPSSVGKSVTEDLVPIEDIPEVHPDMQKKLQAHGISSYFPVQAAVIPTLLESIANGFLVARGGYRPSDLCVSAPTGSGKTLAFVIPVVQALLCRAVCQVRALVVLPTKELAQQVSKVFNIYTDATPLRVALITGQKSLVKEQESLVQKTVDGFRCLADVVVATPGRLVDHIDQTPGFSLQHLRFLIIDEADRMIDSMHQSWLPRVVEAAFPSDVANDPFALLQRRQLQATTAASISCPQMPLQKLLFSATLTQNPEKLQQLGLYQPRLFSTGLAGRGPRDIDRDGESGGKYTFPTGLSHHYVPCSLRTKPLAILHLILERNFSRVLCFTNSRENSHRLFLLVQAFGGVAAAEFSSRCRPGQRKVVLKQFEQGKIQLVGRTARAGRTGQAFTLLLKVQERRFLQMLAEAGVPKMARHDIHSELLQPLVPRYEEALSQLEQAVKEERRQKVA
ncbi:ATP-dependent RNA helicase DDX51 isoform X2 [Canis lupus baileyi]|uniref:ATP-dependent RNA helicase DDX51 isoform X2 n=1 Tax=Canis lupus familiaris TaxID=9615 RepID=UPI0003AE0475|nr:ATP-dependent RNA helicase DDX51 isoform X2 [Canis lupus familiaris]XP_038292231.1 ATP-dependent RNA helicase DDX51 isoform X2 [Canis lupus familiaris]|eukprot:XP_005636133.1 ATP-dependent RNA helicase DDX51 isoform X2 [Canis lupus familiaris]